MPAKDYYLPSRQLVSQQDAAITERPNVPRSRFSGSWTRKTTFDAGYLVPFLVDEILPGDHMKYNVTAYIRMATPLFPLFDNQRIDTFFFYVPNRILWDRWKRFMGEEPNPGDGIAGDDNLPPEIMTDVGGHAAGSIYDHMGLPTTAQIDPALTYRHSSLPLRAYNKIYNDWFRDQNLITKATEMIGSSGVDPSDAVGAYVLRRRAKSHDYFTSALPWPQKFTAPTIPLDGRLNVASDSAVSTALTAYMTTTEEYRHLTASGAYAMFDATGSVSESQQLYVDLANTLGIPINEFRQAFLIQQMLERDARGGTRYVEILKSHFGVISPDFRLQRPEYIGGGQSPLQLTPVAQTAPTAGVPVGALGAAGTGVGQHTASYAATEHGWIIGIINIRTELSYQQGINRMWTRRTRYDHYWPSLAGLGEKAILRKELYMTGDPALDDLVFGYQESWHEYRTRYSEVTGVMKSVGIGAEPTLDPWHLAQSFSAAPLLNQTFIEDTPPMERVLAAGALAVDQQYLADILINRTAVRAVPAYGTPVMLGRF